MANRVAFSLVENDIGQFLPLTQPSSTHLMESETWRMTKILLS